MELFVWGVVGAGSALISRALVGGWYVRAQMVALLGALAGIAAGAVLDVLISGRIVSEIVDLPSTLAAFAAGGFVATLAVAVASMRRPQIADRLNAK